MAVGSVFRPKFGEFEAFETIARTIK